MMLTVESLTVARIDFVLKQDGGSCRSSEFTAKTPCVTQNKYVTKHNYK